MVIPDLVVDFGWDLEFEETRRVTPRVVEHALTSRASLPQWVGPSIGQRGGGVVNATGMGHFFKLAPVYENKLLCSSGIPQRSAHAAFFNRCPQGG